MGVGLTQTIRQSEALIAQARRLASQAGEVLVASREAVARSELLLQELYELRQCFGEGDPRPFRVGANKVKR